MAPRRLAWLDHDARPDVDEHLVDQLDIPLIGRGLDGRIVSWNGAAVRLLGWSEHEALGQPFTTVLEGERDLDAEATAVSDGAWSGTVRFRTRGGAPVSARVQLVAWRMDGVLRGFVSALFPEPERSSATAVTPPAEPVEPAAEEVAAAVLDRIEAIARHLDDPIVTLDAEGRVVAANRPASELFQGRIRPGISFHQAAHPAGTPSCDAACPLRTLDEHPDQMQLVTFDLSDGPTELRCGAFPVAGADGSSIVLLTPVEVDDVGDDERRRRRALDRTIETQLRIALQERTLSLYAQPIVEAATGRVVQREILVRLIGASGVMMPSDFLPVAERCGLAVDIDRYVVKEALRHSRYGVSVELNLSPVSLQTPGFADEIAEMVAAYDTDPAQIVFEITESAILSDASAALEFCQRLDEIGCRFALDDFGTGFNGLLQLRHFPVDFLKIDREFVRNLTTDDRNRPIVRAVIALAEHLGVRTVAEGVEDRETLELLRDDGVDLVQGYLLGRPEPLPI
jgi:PAS domain S-box-containing protein